MIRTHCKHCNQPQHVHRGGVTYCRECDRLHLMTVPTPAGDDDDTRPEGDTTE